MNKEERSFEEMKKEKSMQMYFFSKYKLKIGASVARAIRKEIESLQEDWVSVEDFTEIINWLLGHFDFPQQKENEGKYYWRSHLRKKLIEKNLLPKPPITKKRGGCNP